MKVFHLEWIQGLSEVTSFMLGRNAESWWSPCRTVAPYEREVLSRRPTEFPWRL